MKKILALVFILIICGAALAEYDYDPDTLFEGVWEDIESQRAWMRIDHNWDGDYNVRVYWGSGVYEGDEWYMTGVFDPETVSLAYRDGSHYTCTYDDDGDLVEIVTHYEDARGSIYFDSADYLRFDCGDESLLSCAFEWNGD